MRYAIILTLAITTNAFAGVITHVTPFRVTDAIRGSASNLAADDTLMIRTDNRRVGPDSLPRFDPSLGQLDTVTLSVEFDRIAVDIPISYSAADGGATTANIDELSLGRAYVTAALTGLIRPFVFGSGAQVLDLIDLDTEGLLTRTPSSGQINIRGEVDGFPFASSREAPAVLVEGDAVFSFTGTESYELVRRTTNQFSVSLDQDGFDVEVDGSIEYSGSLSVTYGFTPFALAGDFNGDGSVDTADYAVWRDNLGRDEGDLLNGNGTGGIIDEGDFDLWVANFGQTLAPVAAAIAAIPEPATVGLVGATLLAAALRGRGRRA